MKKYKVLWTEQVTYSVEIEASSEQEAKNLIVGGEFRSYNEEERSFTEILSVEKISLYIGKKYANLYQ